MKIAETFRGNTCGLCWPNSCDAVNKVLGTSEDFGNFAREGALAIEVGTNQLSGDAERVLQVFGRGRRESTCECDRRTESDLRQFIFLANDKSITQKIESGSIRNLVLLENDQLVPQLYLKSSVADRMCRNSISVSNT